MITRKTNKLMMAAAALLLMPASCDLPTGDDLISELSVDKTTIDAAKERGTYTVAVTATVPWTAASSAEWCTVSPDSGDGDGTLSITVATNTDTARTAILTVAASGVEAKTVTVTQAAKDSMPILEVSAPGIAAAADANTYTVSITSNSSWAVASSEGWCTVSPASGVGDATLTVAVTAYTDSLARKAILTITASGVEAKTVTVTQAAKSIPVLEVSTSSVAAVADGGAYTVAITSSGAWTAVSNEGWCTVSPASGVGDATLTITAAASTDTLARTAILTVTASGVEAKTVTVTQAAKSIPVLEISTSGIAAVADGSTYTVAITSSGAWTAVSSAGWCTVNPASGVGNATLSIAVAASTDALERTANVTVAANGAKAKTVTVTQAAKDSIPASDSVPVLEVNTSSFAVAEGGGTYTVVITSNCQWTVSGNDMWYFVSPASGFGNAILSITVAANGAESVRTSTFTVAANGAEAKTVTVTQAAKK
ncbi:MAG: BACON domain-containing protein [Prevotellaceae bacterium]|jgi:hypothetical protein|nr:BACON domain-containing protein [Prevotellaceae bacterium]